MEAYAEWEGRGKVNGEEEFSTFTHYYKLVLCFEANTL